MSLPSIACCLLCAFLARASGYKNFGVAVYARAYEVQQMQDPAWLESRWAAITTDLKVDKIYLETHRDGVIPDQQTLDAVKRFFKSKGVATAAGIATPGQGRQEGVRSYFGPGFVPGGVG